MGFALSIARKPMHRFQIMSISFANALGIHDKALSFRAQRAEVLANNLANADTPNFKARDLDFASVLAEQNNKAKGGQFQIARDRSLGRGNTHPVHVQQHRE